MPARSVTRLCGPLLLALCGAAHAQAPRLVSPALDEKILREHQLSTAPADLLNFFRRRTPGPDVIRRFDELLARCASDAYAERAQAAEELAAMGPVIRPLLVRVLGQPPADREVMHRAAILLRGLPAERDDSVALAAARVLARQKADGALVVLLDYAPYAPDELVRQELQLAINDLAGTDGELLRAAVRGDDPLRRAAAGEALARGGAAGKALARPLLRDPSPRVRLPIGLALAELGEADAVPVLIELLAVLPPDLAWSAQELLLRLPDDDALALLPVLGGPLPPDKVGADWARWWEKNQARVDLGVLHGKAAEQGLTLVTHAANGLNGRVVALDAREQTVWQIEGLRYPVDVQMVGKDRVLIAEYLGRRVSERDRKGKVIWERAVQLPVACQRLAGGLTFIACRQQLLLIDRHGRDVFVHCRTGPSIVAGQRLRDGQMVIACASGTCHLLDAQGNELRSFRIGQLYTMGSSIEVLPGGRVLVPLYSENRVVEYDFDGNVLWQASATRPTSAVRLPSGNTLIVSQTPSRVFEITPQGKEVWSHIPTGRPWRARRI